MKEKMKKTERKMGKKQEEKTKVVRTEKRVELEEELLKE